MQKVNTPTATFQTNKAKGTVTTAATTIAILESKREYRRNPWELGNLECCAEWCDFSLPLYCDNMQSEKSHFFEIH